MVHEANPNGDTKMDIRVHAVAIALHIIAARDDGRVALSRAASDAFERADAIMEADAVLGAVCCADLCDALIPQMAENAYVIGTIVQNLDAVGLIDVLADERIFWSDPALEISISGFTLLARG